MNDFIRDNHDGWEDREELNYPTYAVGKKVSLQEFYRFIGKDSDDVRLFQTLEIADNEEYQTDDLKIKKVTGFTVISKQEDYYYLVHLTR